MKRLAILASLVLLIASGCRTVTPVRQIRPTWSPDISRLILLNGNVVEFNGDFGWYDKKAGIIEGMTRDSQHVEFHLSEVSRVETVRSYELLIGIITVLMPITLGFYLLGKLLGLVSYL